MRDYWPPADPHADIEADYDRAARRARAARRRAQKLERWMAAIEARIAKLQKAGATHIHLHESEDDGELPSLTYSFAPNPKAAAQAIFDDARPRSASGLV